MRGQGTEFLITITGVLRSCILVALVAALVSAAVAGEKPPPEFSNAVASRLLQQVTEGFNSSNQGEVLAAFDRARMKNYDQFRANIQALFAQYESFRAGYNLRQSWAQGERGVVMVEFELEGTPPGEGSAPFRRSAQLRFEFERGRAGWKIVDVSPREFF